MSTNTQNTTTATTTQSQATNGQALSIASPTSNDWVAPLLADPDGFTPTEPKHLFGPANSTALKTLKIAENLRTGGMGPHTILLYGPSGTGKTCIANMFCRALTNQDHNITEVAGATLTKEIVAGWVKDQFYRQVGFRIIHIDEINLCSNEAKNLFLSLLNYVPNDWVFIATTNAKPTPNAFWSRWSCYQVDPPTKREIEVWLETIIKLPGVKARSIARTCGQNVRWAQKAAANHFG